METMVALEEEVEEEAEEEQEKEVEEEGEEKVGNLEATATSSTSHLSSPHGLSGCVQGFSLMVSLRQALTPSLRPPNFPAILFGKKRIT